MSFLLSVARALNPFSWLLRSRRKQDVIQSEYEFQPEVEVDPVDDVDSPNGQVSDSSEAEIEERVTKNDGKSEEAPQLHDDECSDQNPADSVTAQDRLPSYDNACSLRSGDEVVEVEQENTEEPTSIASRENGNEEEATATNTNSNACNFSPSTSASVEDSGKAEDEQKAAETLCEHSTPEAGDAEVALISPTPIMSFGKPVINEAASERKRRASDNLSNDGEITAELERITTEQTLRGRGRRSLNTAAGKYAGSMDLQSVSSVPPTPANTPVLPQRKRHKGEVYNSS